MLTRLLYGLFHLLGNLVAMGLVCYILLPQTIPFGDDKEVLNKLYTASLKWPFKPSNVEAVMGPCSQIITADDTIWEAQWSRIYADQWDLVEVTWHVYLENDVVGTLRMKRTKRLLIGWEWTKATLYEKLKTLPVTMRVKAKIDVMMYEAKRYPFMT